MPKVTLNADELTNETPIVTKAQHQTLLDAADVYEHLAKQAEMDVKRGNCPPEMPSEMRELGAKAAGIAMLLAACDMVSDEE